MKVVNFAVSMVFLDIERRKIILIFVADNGTTFPSTKLDIVDQLAVDLPAKCRMRILPLMTTRWVTFEYR